MGGCCATEANKNTSDGNVPELASQNTIRKSKQLMQATTVTAAGPGAAQSRTDSFSTDFSSRAQSFAGGRMMEEEDGTNIRGSITNKMNLSIDIPLDKKADRNPSFKTPIQVEAEAAAL